MRIGIVSFADIESGLDLANIMHAAGHEVCIYLSQTKVTPVIGASENQAEQIYARNLLPRAVTVEVFRFPRIRDPRSFNIVMQMRRRIAEDRLDILHVMVGPLEIWLSVLVLLVNFIPVVTTIIIPKPNYGEVMPAWVEKAINRIATFGSQLIIVNGEKWVDYVNKTYGFPQARVIYIPLAPRITITRWDQLNIAAEKHTVLFQGRALPHKGLEFLVQAEPKITGQLPDAKFIISVHGDEIELWRDLLSQIQHNPHFEIHEGFMPGEVMAAYYQRSTLVALPYISASTSGILLDSYSFGKPVVATSVGSFPEYVNHGETGLLIPPADPDALADAILRLLTDEYLCREMGKNALAWIERLKLQVIETLEDVYHQSIQEFSKKKEK